MLPSGLLPPGQPLPAYSQVGCSCRARAVESTINIAIITDVETSPLAAPNINIESLNASRRV
jgi:hypothetical protein